MGSRPFTILTQLISFLEDAIRDKDNEMKSAYATLIFLTKRTLWSFSNFLGSNSFNQERKVEMIQI